MSTTTAFTLTVRGANDSMHLKNMLLLARDVQTPAQHFLDN
jgi:hypothetical protein